MPNCCQAATLARLGAHGSAAHDEPMDLTRAERATPPSPSGNWPESLFGGDAIVTYLPSGPTLVLSRLDPDAGDRLTLTLNDQTGDPNPGLHTMGCVHCHVFYGEMTTGHSTRGDGTDCWDVHELDTAAGQPTRTTLRGQ